MRTWLVIAAESREFDGILKRFGGARDLSWPEAEFSKELNWKGDRWCLVANGPGQGLVRKALERKMEVTGLISTGFCGALDPALRVGEIVVSGEFPGASEAIRGTIVTTDRVAVTAAEKRKLLATTGAAAVEMEAGAVAAKAAEWGVPFYCVRVVSDRADEDMPLDFNLYRDAEGRFSRSRIAMAAMAKPFARIPALLRLERNCRQASESLGAFFADCRL
jgi:adenosylhomocysteine nucleosidase